jgi:mannosyltransferase
MLGSPGLRASVGVRIPLAVILLIVAAGASVRLYGVTSQSLGYDEAVSWRLVAFDVPDIVARTADDVHPPLYYLLLKAWVGCFGDSLAVMRSLSAALDILGLLLIFGLTVDLHRAVPGAVEGGTAVRVGTLATALAAASPFLVVHAREARMYPLGVLLAVASSWALWRALRESGPAVWSWVAYAVTACGLVYTHNYGLFTVAAQTAFALSWLGWEVARGRARPTAPRRLLGAFAAILAVGLAYSPWIPTLIRQRQRVVDEYWTRSLSTTLFGGAVEQLLTGDIEVHRIDAGGTLAVVAGVVLVALLARGRTADRYLVLLSAGPLVAAAIISLAQGRNIVIGRYLAFGLPFYLIGLASLVGSIPAAPARTGLAVLLVGMSIFQMVDVAVPRRGGADGIQTAVRELLDNRRPGDVVLTTGAGDHLVACYYLQGQARSSILLSPGVRLRHYDAASVIAADEVTTADRLDGEPGSRAWVLISERLSTHHPRFPDRWRILKSSRFAGSAIYGGRFYLELWALDGGPQPGSTRVQPRLDLLSRSEGPSLAEATRSPGANRPGLRSD